MRFLKWKSLLNVLSFGGIRVIVFSSALLGSVLVTYAGYSLYEQIYTQNRAFDSGVERFTTTEEIQEAQQSLTDSVQDYRDSKLPFMVLLLAGFVLLGGFFIVRKKKED